MKITLVKVEDTTYGFTFRTFYGRWQTKRANIYVKLMKEYNIKAEVLL